MVTTSHHIYRDPARSNSGPTVAQTWRVARRSSNRNPDEPRAAAPRLDAGGLERLALRYVERYATTRAKLSQYLARKLRERGWAAEDGAPEAVAALVGKIARLGYVDDRAFAEVRAAGLARRGFGARRRQDALRAAGVERADADASEETVEDEGGWPSALAFARRRRFGPYADVPAEPERRQKQIGAMLRAGHAPRIARAIVMAEPGGMPAEIS